MLRFASKSSDPPLTENEEEVYECILALGAEVTAQELVAWCGAQQQDVATMTPQAEKEYRCAMAIERLTASQRRILRSVIERHPNTRFLGYDETPHLQRAFELARPRVTEHVA
ncbi:MAG: hypothetical protein Q7T01_05040 [bacterium]|nr:hypothetical protein [bacterium]